MVLVAVVACEVGFWLVLVAGLLLRYPLRRQRAGGIVLLCLPAVDLALFAFTVADLRSGATPTTAHGLAAVYLGVTVAFGHGMVRWADVRFAHRFAGGPPPAPKPAGGTPERVRLEWREMGKAVLGGALAAVLLLGAIALVGEHTDTGVFWDWLGRIAVVLGIWLLGWPVWETARMVGRQRTPSKQES